MGLEPLTFASGGDPVAFTNKQRRKMNWRPTVFCIVYTTSGRYLVLREKANRVGRADPKIRYSKTRGGLPKGGVDCDTPITAVYRELWEEVRIPRPHIQSATYLGRFKVPFDRHNQGRDGYRQGKLYLVYVVKLKPGARFAPGRDHNVLSTLLVLDPWNYVTKRHRWKHKRKQEKDELVKPSAKRVLLMDRQLRALLRKHRRA